MKRTFICQLFARAILPAVVFLFSITQSNAQQHKPVSSGYAPVDGTTVYYEVYGEGKPIVLLHGAFMTLETNWGQLIPELSETRKVIAIELQGHGHTPFSERKLAHTTLANDVEKLMDHLKVDSADIVGYSFGGSVAYQFAIQSPKRVKKLVIISSTYKTDGWMPQVSGAMKGLTPDIFDNSPMKTAYEAVAPDKTKWTKFLEQMIAFAGTSFNMGDSNIAKIKVPVLLIAGDNDGLDKIELVKTYQLLGGAVMGDIEGVSASHLAIVPGQTHVSLMMQTEILAGYLKSFLR